MNEKFESDLKRLMAEIDKTKAKPKATLKRPDPNNKGTSRTPHMSVELELELELEKAQRQMKAQQQEIAALKTKLEMKTGFEQYWA